MPSLYNFAKAIDRATSGINYAQRTELADRVESDRTIRTKQWYEQGGELFWDWVQENYRTHTGSKIKDKEPYVQEIYLLYGNPWFKREVYEKAAQMGFSECMIAFSAFALGHLRIALGVGFETNGKIYEMVGQRIQPAFDQCPPIQELQSQRLAKMGRADIDNKGALTVGGVSANFFYGKINSTGKGEARQAPSKISSFAAQAILGDEYELWSRPTLDIAEKRMQYSDLPTKIMRYGSTPGAVGGLVDTDVKLANYIFAWYVTCDRCGTSQFIDAYGNFLKATEVENEGKVEELYISPIGRPLDWFHHDKENPESTAYIGCSHCAAELTRSVLDAGYFACTKTGVTLRSLCQQVLKERTPVDRVALKMPRLASFKFDPVESLRKLLKSESPVDELQQGLGKAASFSSGGISYERILDCVGLDLSSEIGDRMCDVRMLVVDVGRYGHHAQVQEWYWGTGENHTERWVNANKVITWYGKVKDLDEDMDRVCKQFQCHIIVIDNEPEFHYATTYALKHPPRRYSEDMYDTWSFDDVQVFLIDQMKLKGGRYKRTLRDVDTSKKKNKVQVVIYNLDRTWCIDMVKSRIYRQRQVFPANLVYDPDNREENLISHYLSSERTTDGSWIEGSGESDHWLLSDSTGEAVALALPFEKGKSGFFFASARQDL